MKAIGYKVPGPIAADAADRKSTRLNSSHGYISYAVFCLKKKSHRLDQAAADTAARKAQIDIQQTYVDQSYTQPPLGQLGLSRTALLVRALHAYVAVQAC